MFEILQPTKIYDVAIVGSGAAGGMTAHVLTEKGLDVAMLEAGALRRPSEFPTHRMRRWNLPHRGLRGDYMEEWLRATNFFADDRQEPYGWAGDDPFEWVRIRAVGGKSLFWAGERAMFADFLEVAGEIMRKAGAEMVRPAQPPKPFKAGASIHYVGTARMGDDPKTSVLNKWNQSHDVPNLFVHDAAAFVTAGNQNPTLTIMALALRSSERLTRLLS